MAELLGNVVRHAAGPAWISITWPAAHPVLTVQDLGPGFLLDPGLPRHLDDESGRGLFIASRLTAELSAAVRHAGGARVTAELAVERAPSPSYHPRRRGRGALPRPEEAEPGKGFGKEAFLRALVVELAQGIEAIHGPAAAETAIAQAGTDIGGQMETEFRLARRIVGRMAPAQMAECFVRLKHAVDGNFGVLEVAADRIVLGNDRCPFGSAVREAPALCRMTSSVFGGIAARNTDGGASVVLEERIAVGDPGCRVVVYLDRPPEDARVAHRYPADEPIEVAVPDEGDDAESSAGGSAGPGAGPAFGYTSRQGVP